MCCVLHALIAEMCFTYVDKNVVTWYASLNQSDNQSDNQSVSRCCGRSCVCWSRGPQDASLLLVRRHRQHVLANGVQRPTWASEALSLQPSILPSPTLLSSLTPLLFQYVISAFLASILMTLSSRSNLKRFEIMGQKILVGFSDTFYFVSSWFFLYDALARNTVADTHTLVCSCHLL